MNEKETTMARLKLLLAGITVVLIVQGSIATVEGSTLSMKDVSSNIGFASVVSEEIDEKSYIAFAVSGENDISGYETLGVVQVDGSLNVRAEASTTASIVGKMMDNSACEIIGEEGDFYHIISGEITGYISKEFVVDGIEAKVLATELAYKRAISTTNGLNIREEASEDAPVYSQLSSGEQLKVVEELDGWVKCLMDTDEVYVKAEYVEIVEGLDTAITIAQATYGMEVSELRIEIVEYAKQFLGNPYVYGGTSLTNGTDCSGFSQGVMSNFGISIPRTSSAQSGSGTSVAVSDMLPGDLVFYANSSGNVNHVAIYMGGGQVIHASNPETGIRISDTYYRTPVGARRVIAE